MVAVHGWGKPAAGQPQGVALTGRGSEGEMPLLQEKCEQVLVCRFKSSRLRRCAASDLTKDGLDLLWRLAMAGQSLSGQVKYAIGKALRKILP